MWDKAARNRSNDAEASASIEETRLGQMSCWCFMTIPKGEEL